MTLKLSLESGISRSNDIRVAFLPRDRQNDQTQNNDIFYILAIVKTQWVIRKENDTDSCVASH